MAENGDLNCYGNGRGWVDCGHLPFAISTGYEQARRTILMSDGISCGWKLCYYFAALAIFGTFSAFGEPDRGVVGGFSFAVIVLAAKIRWDLRTELWYQALFALLTTAHVVALFAVDWKLLLKPTILYAPLATAEFVLIVFLVFILEKRLGTKQNEP